jgi:hypothetical protein
VDLGIVDLAVALACVLGPAGPREQPDLKTLLHRAGEYAVGYHDRFTALVADEDYVQRTGPDPRRPPMGRSLVEKQRTLKSEYVIVRDFAGEGSWVGVRDVIEVDGEPAPDRGRLHALLEDTSRPLTSRLRALADLEARYNIGDVYRTINVPTLPLEFLLPDRQPRFRFKAGGRATLDGADAWRVSFDERERPTIIRSPNGKNVPSRGTFWLDPETGAVLRSELQVTPGAGLAVQAVIIVSYTRNARLDMLLPEDMNEMYFTRAGRIEGHATYSNYRRFETDVRIK